MYASNMLFRVLLGFVLKFVVFLFYPFFWHNPFDFDKWRQVMKFNISTYDHCDCGERALPQTVDRPSPVAHRCDFPV